MDSDTTQFHQFPVFLVAPYKCELSRCVSKWKFPTNLPSALFSVVKRLHATDANWSKMFCSCLWFHFGEFNAWLYKTKTKSFHSYALSFELHARCSVALSRFTVHGSCNSTAISMCRFTLNWIRIYSTYDFTTKFLF